MDLVRQSILNVVVLYVGATFLTCLGKFTNKWIFWPTAWFGGWILLAISDTALVAAGVHVQLLYIFGGAFVFLIASFLLPSNGLSGKETKSILWSGAAVTLICIICPFVLNVVILSPDSHTYLGLGRIFHKYSMHDTSQQFVTTWLTHKRLPYVISIYNLAYLMGINIYTSYTILSAGFLIMGCAGCWLDENMLWCDGELNWSLLLLLILPLLVDYNYLYHATWILSNLPTAAYFTLGTLMLYACLRKGDGGFWLGLLFLAVTGMIRKEMLLFSLIPVCLFFIIRHVPLHKRFAGMLLFGAIAYLWPLSVLTDNGISLSRLSSWSLLEGHGNMGIQLGMMGVTAIAFMVVPIIYDQIALKWKASALLCVLVAYVAITRQPLFYSGWVLVTMLFGMRKSWFFVWYLIAGGLLAYTVHLWICWRNQKFDVELPQLFLYLSVIGYFCLRIMLYAHFDGPKDGGSGNRIMLHVLPVALFFVSDWIQLRASQESWWKLEFRTAASQ